MLSVKYVYTCLHYWICQNKNGANARGKHNHMITSNNVHFSSLSLKYCFAFNVIQINLKQFWLAHCLSLSLSYADTRADLLLVGLLCSRSGSGFSNLFFPVLFDFELMVGPKQFKDINLGSRNNNYQLLVGLSGAHMTATSTLIASPSLHVSCLHLYCQLLNKMPQK